jgi:hypothetical protein
MFNPLKRSLSVLGLPLAPALELLTRHLVVAIQGRTNVVDATHLATIARSATRL